jgi:hypothetical protein
MIFLENQTKIFSSIVFVGILVRVTLINKYNNILLNFLPLNFDSIKVKKTKKQKQKQTQKKLSDWHCIFVYLLILIKYITKSAG